MTKYQVRFTLYHYNSGDGRNGRHGHHENFTNVTEALSFRDRLVNMLAEGGTSEFARQYCWDGCLEAVDGVFEVTERKVG